MHIMNRRDVLKTLAAGVGAAVFGGCETSSPAAKQNSGPPRARRDAPNIIVILADDMGWSDIGCYGSEIHTPNIDRLAADGLRFRQFYNCARCCPTRASLLTGLYPHQVGIGHMSDAEFNYNEPGYRGRLDENCVTIAEALKPIGYHTFMTGKWHVTIEEGGWPHDRGFDEFYGIVHGASNFFGIPTDPSAPAITRAFWNFSKLARNNTLVQPEGEDYYTTDAFTDYAVDFIKDCRKPGEPYFLYLAYTAPHFPLQAREEDIAKYRGIYMDGWDDLRRRRFARQKELGLFAADLELTPREEGIPAWDDVQNKEEWELSMAVYAAMIDRMDWNIGRLLETIKQSGEEDNTLILFLSDNGATCESLHNTPELPIDHPYAFQTYDAPWANASNTPFREYKRFVHEGGIRTPLIVKWPARLRQHGITSETGHIIDIMATCLDAAGASYPTNRNGEAIPPLEGKSLLPILETGTRPGHEALYWEHEGNRAVRMGKWKLVSQSSNWGLELDIRKATFYSNEWELYDMEADPLEMHNLALENLGLVHQMSAMYHQWANTHDVLPWNDLISHYNANQIWRQQQSQSK